jgi:hypothetical protein
MPSVPVIRGEASLSDWLEIGRGQPFRKGFPDDPTNETRSKRCRKKASIEASDTGHFVGEEAFLEADSQAELHLAWVIALSVEDAKRSRSLEIEQWIKELVMVQ